MLEHLKQIQPQLRVLLVTALERDEVTIHEEDLVQAYLNKPVELLVLKKTVERVLAEEDARVAAEGNVP